VAGGAIASVAFPAKDKLLANLRKIRG